jgi:SAM-dependent methyltransferase/uncharacterized protein YbaR (Trm112 family)
LSASSHPTVTQESVEYTVPGTSERLCPSADELRSPDGQRSYPLVAGVPVIFPTELHPTFDAYSASRGAIDTADEWQIETLAIDPPDKERVRKLIEGGCPGGVDPAVSYLVMATNGIAYEAMMGQLDHYPIPKIPLPPANGAKLLDIGCSWGRWCASAARLGYRTHGIDPSLAAVLAARRMFRQLDLEGEFVCGDGRSLPFPDASFDVVYSYSVLQHFSDENADAAWSEIGRVLKPNGVALVQMANALGIRSMSHQVRRGFRRPQVFEVRYRRPRQLIEFGRRHVGPTDLMVDCFLGLGLQESDKHLFRGSARAAVGISESLKRLARFFSPLIWVADSVFVRSHRTVPNSSRNSTRHA